ncbi:hypothetical protein IJE86_07880 [bacterium]|nr:hypothetical protein [bacterium]
MESRLLFTPLYINGVLASEQDRKRFAFDYISGKIKVKRARLDKAKQVGFVETF